MLTANSSYFFPAPPRERVRCRPTRRWSSGGTRSPSAWRRAGLADDVQNRGGAFEVVDFSSLAVQAYPFSGSRG